MYVPNFNQDARIGLAQNGDLTLHSEHMYGQQDETCTSL